MSVIAALKQQTQHLLHIFFPRVCEGCGHPLPYEDAFLCFTCEQHLAIAPIYPQLESEASLRLSGRFPFEAACSLCTFTNGSLIQYLLHQLKYRNKPDIGVALGKLMAGTIADSQWWQTIDYILPIPLHEKKERLRGYNQSLYIARGMTEVSGKALSFGNLLRIKHTESQTTKSRIERLENVGDAFFLKDPKQLNGKHLLLVDDVLTTGATLESCAKVLIAEAGCTISVATLAVAS